MPGIFDLGWLPFSERPILAAALADGSLRLLEVDNNNNNTNVVEVARVESPEQGGMALSVECRHPSTDSNDNALVSSYSDGTIALHKVCYIIFQIILLFFLIFIIITMLCCSGFLQES